MDSTEQRTPAPSTTANNRVCVCVLGDIGHSPRMQYHSISLAEHDYQVDIVGYLDSKPHERLLSNPKIKIHGIPIYKNVPYVPRLMNYVFKVFYQVLYLFLMLISIPKPSHFLVQNPPSVPALMVVWFVSRIRGSQYIVDWHNYGFTILGMSLGEKHIFVKFYRFLEFCFGGLSDKALCVSKAMQKDLQTRVQKSSTVLYDRPFSFFKTLTLEEKHQFWLRFQEEHSELKSDKNSTETMFTKIGIDGNVQEKTDAPIVFISSSSWTEDEDFLLLLNALIVFDHMHASSLIQNQQSLKVLCIITGKGPMKSFYMTKIAQHKFKHTKFLFPWLTAEDYPKILACSTLGICLHKSSSGLDLPMKVVDMFGVRLPVCAYNYSTIPELVTVNVNGKLFSNQTQLVACLEELFSDYPKCETLQTYRRRLEETFAPQTWSKNWTENALPLFKD